MLNMAGVFEKVAEKSNNLAEQTKKLDLINTVNRIEALRKELESLRQHEARLMEELDCSIVIVDGKVELA